MTVIMIASTVSHPSGPMVGGYAGKHKWKAINDEPQWKMKGDIVQDFEELVPGHLSSASACPDLPVDPDWSALALGDGIDSVDISGLIGLLEDEESYNMFAQLMDNSDSADELEAALPLSGARFSAGESLTANATAVIEEHDYSLATYRPSPPAPASRAASTTSGYSSGPDPEESVSSVDDVVVSVKCLGSEGMSRMRSLLTDQTRQMLEKAKAQRIAASNSRVRPDELSDRSCFRGRQTRKRKSAQETSAQSSSRIKKWSQMSGQEKQESLMQLTEVISKQLGLRERLEAIRIVNPNSNVTPSDSECTIDMDLINDCRFSKLQRFVRRHADDFAVSSTRTPQTELSRLTSDYRINTEGERGHSLGSNSSENRGHSFGSHYKKLSDDSDSDEAGKNIIIINEVDEQKKSEQLLKERHSGLFAFEVRVHCQADDDDAEDIDILQ